MFNEGEENVGNGNLTGSVRTNESLGWLDLLRLIWLEGQPVSAAQHVTKRACRVTSWVQSAHKVRSNEGWLTEQLINWKKIKEWLQGCMVLSTRPRDRMLPFAHQTTSSIDPCTPFFGVRGVRHIDKLLAARYGTTEKNSKLLCVDCLQSTFPSSATTRWVSCVFEDQDRFGLCCSSTYFVVLELLLDWRFSSHSWPFDNQDGTDFHCFRVGFFRTISEMIQFIFSTSLFWWSLVRDVNVRYIIDVFAPCFSPTMNKLTFMKGFVPLEAARIEVYFPFRPILFVNSLARRWCSWNERTPYLCPRGFWHGI